LKTIHKKQDNVKYTEVNSDYGFIKLLNQDEESDRTKLGFRNNETL